MLTIREAAELFLESIQELDEKFDPMKDKHPHGGTVSTAVDYFNKNEKGEPLLVTSFRPNRAPGKRQTRLPKSHDVAKTYDEDQAIRNKHEYAKKFGYHVLTPIDKAGQEREKRVLGEEFELEEGKDVPTSHKVGDTVWAKHPTDKSKTMTGKVTMVGRTGYNVKHKDGSTGWYPHKDVSAEYPHKIAYAESAQLDEGITDTIKRAAKSVKRGMQGWGTGDGLGDGNKPKDILRRSKGYDDETIKGLSKFRKGYDAQRIPAKHSPQDLQNRVLDREMKKRGLSEDTLEENYSKHSFMARALDKEIGTAADKKAMAADALKAHTRAYNTAPSEIMKSYHIKKIDTYKKLSEGKED